MKRFLLIPLLAILAFAVNAQKQDSNGKTDQKAQYQVFGVAFYNLENLFDTIPNNPLGRDEEFTPSGSRRWTGDRYWSKINNLARAISNFTTQTTPNGPAFIGVSEIENRSVLEDLVKAVDDRLVAEGKKPWNLQIVHHDSPDRRGVDVGALYNPRYFRLMNVSNTPLLFPDDPTFRTRDQMCVTGVMGGDTISMIVNHWPSRLGGEEKSSPKREAAAAVSKHIADSLWTLRPNQGVIIMGDLNDDPQNKSCAQVLGASKKQNGVQPHGFYNPFWSLLDKGIATLVYNGTWNLFDQIIVSGNLLEANNDSKQDLHFWKAQVNNFNFLCDKEGSRKDYPLRTYSSGVFLNGYSDHFPTEIFLIRQK
jgi:hypothetical protein